MSQAVRNTGRAIIINNNNEFLLVKMGKVRTMPGGGIDFGESLGNAIARESLEELGIAACFEKIIFIQDYTGERKGKETHFLEFFCSVKNNDDFINIFETTKKASHGEELQDIGRFALEDFSSMFLPTKLIPVLKEYLLSRKFFEVRYCSDLG